MQIEKEKGIELRQLLKVLWKKLWLIALVMALCGTLSVIVTKLFVTPQYRAAAMFYVNINVFPSTEETGEGTSEDPSAPEEETSSTAPGDSEVSKEEEIIFSSGSLSVSKSLVESYQVILKTRQTMQEVLDQCGVARDPNELINMVDITSVGGTEIFQVTVTGTQPEEVWQIAQGISVVLPQRITKIVENTKVHVLEAPVYSASPSIPSVSLNALIGLYIGFLISTGVLIALEFLRVHIHTEEDVAKYTDAPILAAVPDMTGSDSGYYYGYGAKVYQHPLKDKGKRSLVGNEISFEGAEAYKLLRIKLDFAVAGEHACKVIGITSAIAAEGKSITAVNLAYTLSQLGQRVLLIDGDLRRPSVGFKLPVIKSPGLSEWLTGQCELETLFQPCGLPGDETAFQVICAGAMVPNPVELLSGRKLSDLIDILRQRFDRIIVDMPPAGLVSDPLVVSEWTDGVLLVVRQDHCKRRALNHVIGQLAYMNRRLLGIVYNCAGARRERTYLKRIYIRARRRYSGMYVAKGKKNHKS